MASDKRKLSLFEALRYYPQLVALTFLGPADQDGANDPIYRLKRNYGRL